MAANWNLEGTYLEACTCEAACPCIFGSDPSHGSCTFVVGWHLEDGRHGDVSLQGLNVALGGVSPGNMSDGNWKVALYIDEKADEAQTDALARIFSGQEGGFFGELVGAFVSESLGMKKTAIEVEGTGRIRRLRIPNVIEAEVEALEGAGGREVTVNNVPLGLTPGHSPTVALSKQASYKDHGITLEVSGKNALYSSFRYEGP